MDLNKLPLPSRFELGDKVIAGKNSLFPEDIDGARQWHDFATGDSTVVAVTFRHGKVSYTVATPTGNERVFDSADVEPAPVVGDVSADQSDVPDGYTRHDGFVKCDATALEAKFAQAAEGFDRKQP